MQEMPAASQAYFIHTAGRADQNTGRPARLKFWEIESFFKCPIVGMCLTLSEQKQLLKKAGVSLKGKNQFELHETLVGCSENENRLSRKVDSLLARKFGNEFGPLLDLDESAFLQNWRRNFGMGDYKGALWAAASRRGMSIKVKREIFGSVHMDMHSNAEQCGTMKTRLLKQEEELREARLQLKSEVSARRSLQKENSKLTRMKEEIKDGLAFAEREKERLANEIDSSIDKARIGDLEREKHLLQKNLNALSKKVTAMNRRIVSLNARNKRLTNELQTEREMTACHLDETQEIIEEFMNLNRCDASCPSFDLCKKRVLIVGGVTRMESLYRRLIENSGGIFEYHDGYMKNGVRNLESRLRRADVVLCPVNCNSHAACSLVKNLGKKYNKPVHMLTTSSLSAVSQIIWQAGSVSQPVTPEQCAAP